MKQTIWYLKAIEKQLKLSSVGLFNQSTWLANWKISTHALGLDLSRNNTYLGIEQNLQYNFVLERKKLKESIGHRLVEICYFALKTKSLLNLITTIRWIHWKDILTADTNISPLTNTGYVHSTMYVHSNVSCRSNLTFSNFSIIQLKNKLNVLGGPMV